MPRVNRVIELIQADQPIFATGVRDLSYESGRAAIETPYDMLMIDFEHHPFDMIGLRALLKGMVDAGPTRSGHRTVPVCVTLPVLGTSAEAVRSNTWQINHVLAAGAHGILLCNAENPEAVRAFVSATRYGCNRQGVGRLEAGRRGLGGQGYAAGIWGVSPDEYLRKADPWPLNPEGELFLGLKIENERALLNCEGTLMTPGIAFAEWGPGDMGMSLAGANYLRPGGGTHPEFHHDPPYGEVMLAAQRRVHEACKANGVTFYSTMRIPDWRDLYERGVRASSVTADTPTFIEELRRLAGRAMPV